MCRQVTYRRPSEVVPTSENLGRHLQPLIPNVRNFDSKNQSNRSTSASRAWDGPMQGIVGANAAALDVERLRVAFQLATEE
jgi:hypothetical protein